ncbi:MAG: hypothetical protein ABJM26_13405 [Anderseniella sp.]
MALLRIAIPFYDRVWLLKHCLATLAKVTRREDVDFAIYLDHGFEPEASQTISELLPEASTIASERNLGAGGASHRILSDYADNQETERLLIVDADMIVRTDLVATILDWPVRNDMIISVYNSCLHQPIHMSSAPFVHKKRLGTTGTLWSPEVARLVIGNVPSAPYYDDRFSEFLVARNIPLCCSNSSLVQHLGIRGENNRAFGEIDYGLNYIADGPEQESAMAAVFNDMMSNQSFHSSHTKRPGVRA